MLTDAEIMAGLRRYWGYERFRPLQERIVRSLLAGRDTCVVMPTGGGKSLCYQLPAALQPGRTTVVVSPLIALMQDQAAQLDQMGIAAALLNSAVAGAEQERIRRQATEGRFRLLYLSPERLARADSPVWLRRVPVARFVIDEAHCISEWGHEFRPEYRQLSGLRQHFPELPIAAFTASATRPVRHDILQQLQLREPDKYIASFYRPNLRYWVCAGDAATQTQRLLAALRHHAPGNTIVYAPTIARVEETVALLARAGIAALPYHGKMDAAQRREHQERWMSDEVTVLVGTVAFGLGIDKANVRAVIHLALPKSVEQYYQEAGRAGRDGEAAECLLLWQKRDAGLLAHFIDQVQDEAERRRGWERYRAIRGLVESGDCRHRRICAHFGEQPQWTECGGCDACGYQPPWRYDVATPEPVSRGRRRGARAPLPAPWHRGGLPADGEAPARGAGARLRAGLPEPMPGGDALHERLREWRRVTAKKAGIPAYVVLHDTSLDDLCRRRPGTQAGLLEVFGIGERKAARYGAELLAIIAGRGAPA